MLRFQTYARQMRWRGIVSLRKLAAMETEVTLLVDEEAKRLAELYAKEQGTNLAALTTAFYKSLAAKQQKHLLSGLHPDVRALYGIAKVPEDLAEKDGKELLADALWERYLQHQ